LEGLYKKIYVVYNAYGNAKRTLDLLRRVLKEAESNLKAGGPLSLTKRLVGVENLLVNLEDIRSSRETVIANALAQLSTLMNFKVAVSTAQTAEDAKRDASALTT
jgi:hypothetical protein